MANPHYVLGIDIGGTKLAVGIFTLAGTRMAAARIPTQAGDGPAAVIGRLVELCRKVVDGAGVPWSAVAAAGVGCGGPLDTTRGLIQEPPNLPGWTEIPLVRLLQESLGIRVILENDANAAALGEHRFGAGRGVANLIYLTVSTGIGAGVIIDHRLYRGANGNAGEIGHISVAYNGRPCNCGSQGCLEAYASGSSLAARAREALSAEPGSLLPILAGGPERITAEIVVAAVRRGDPLAVRLWGETMEILGAGVASAINVFNPARVVMGGGMTNAGDLLFEPVRRIALRRAMRPLAEAVEIVPALLGDEVGVLGAAAVALNFLEVADHAVALG
ncbi:MAG: ROK family protein [Bacteroidota bacterium]